MLMRIVSHHQLGSHLYVVFQYFPKYFINDISNDSPYELGQGSHEIVHKHGTVPCIFMTYSHRGEQIAMQVENQRISSCFPLK